MTALSDDSDCNAKLGMAREREASVFPNQFRVHALARLADKNVRPRHRSAAKPCTGYTRALDYRESHTGSNEIWGTCTGLEEKTTQVLDWLE